MAALLAIIFLRNKAANFSPDRPDSSDGAAGDEAEEGGGVIVLISMIEGTVAGTIRLTNR